MELTHVVVGPAEHGVTEYAELLHSAVGGPKVRAQSVDELLHGGDPVLDAADAVHVTFTDHLFGDSPDQAVANVCELVGQRPLSVSFHDIPQPEEGAERYARRAGAYVRLARRTQVAVVNSEHEAAFFADTDAGVAVIRLPLPEAGDVSEVSVAPETFGLIGFIYPGKGHDRVIDSLGSGRVIALGKCSDGHEYMADELADKAARRGVDFEVTGFLSDAEMWWRMAQIAVPVCAHHHFSASGSLMRWLAAGRKVLVADSTYAREMDRAFPGLIRLVGDNEWPAALREAATDPDFAQPRPAPQWSWSDVAQAWQALWTKGLWPRVSAIVPYYNAPAELDDVVRALEKQTYPGDIEVIVADDGSDELPHPQTDLPLTIVYQEDRGFRAAAARNLGAEHATGDVFCFIDGDTVPRPDYVRAAVAPVLAEPRALVVGVRCHNGAEAEWLRDAYARTRNLRKADDSAFRFVISAVLTVSRELFEHVLFDASMVGYGGEDWEFAYRAVLHGARLVHAPDAVADHREPDWHERTGIDVAEKNAESVALAHRIAHPMARPAGVIFHTADIEVALPHEELPAGVREALTIAWLNFGDVHVIDEPGALFSSDPRVHPDSRGGARWRVVLDQAFAPKQASELRSGPLRVAGEGTVVGTIFKAGADSPDQGMEMSGEVLGEEIRLERYFAGW